MTIRAVSKVTTALAGALVAGIVAVKFAAPAWHSEEDAAPSERTPRLTAFERPPELAAPLPGNDSSISAAGQRLILTGTVVASNPAESLAFFGTDPKHPQTFALNAMLLSGARISAIATDHVLLEHDGGLARVEIGGNWKEPTPAATRAVTVAALEAPGPPVENPNSISDALSLSPAFDPGGVFLGYDVQPGRFGRVFDAWGLKPGDRLIALEGAPMGDLEAGSQMLELVGAGQPLRATVLREGLEVETVLDGAAIAAEKARREQPADEFTAMTTD